MHAPGIYTDAEIEGKAYLYADGDYTGVVYDPREIAGSDDLRVYGGFEDKHREFIDSLRHGRELTLIPVPRHRQDHGGSREDPGNGDPGRGIARESRLPHHLR